MRITDSKQQNLKEQLREFILSKTGKEPQGIDFVLDQFKSIQAKKGEVLLEVNQICRHCYFIVEGCLKISTLNLNGDESTTNLAFEQEWRTSMSSFIHQQPSNERIVAVEAAQLLAINHFAFNELCQQVKGFDQIYKSLLEESYTKSIERVQTLMGMDALDRVKWLLDQHPMIFTRLSNRLIASYLSISEATLSRLKAKL